mgnify:FL=1
MSNEARTPITNTQAAATTAQGQAPVLGGNKSGSKKFKSFHLQMMALGSAIGAGFFVGTGVAVAEAGPAVLISYILAALIVVAVMYSLAELAAAIPSSGSF